MYNNKHYKYYNIHLMKITKANFWLKNIFISLIFLVGLWGLIPSAVMAESIWDKQVGMGTKSGEVGNAFGETVSDRNSVSDIRLVVAKLINVFLGFMGIIFLILIIYGGIMWMTAAGKDDNINKAKSLLVAGVIGLIIVVSSFAIAKLVTDKVVMSTTGTTVPPAN